jgi:hypothetical protein
MRVASIQSEHVVFFFPPTLISSYFRSIVQAVAAKAAFLVGEEGNCGLGHPWSDIGFGSGVEREGFGSRGSPSQ